MTKPPPPSRFPHVSHSAPMIISPPVFTGVWPRTRSLSITEHFPPYVHRRAATDTYALLYVLLRPFGVSPAFRLVGQGSPPSLFFLMGTTCLSHEIRTVHTWTHMSHVHTYFWFLLRTCFICTHVHTCAPCTSVHTCTPRVCT